MSLNNFVRIAYLSYDGLTDPLGQSQILPYMAGLANKGYHITIISFEKPDRYKIIHDKIRQYCNSYNIQWVPLRYHKNPPIISTVYDLLRLRVVLMRLHAEMRYNIVHCRSYPTSLIGLWAKRKFDIKFIFDMRGFWPDERLEGGIWNLSNPIYRIIYGFFKRKELDFLNHSDEIVTLTYNAKGVIESWNAKTPITVVPTCVDLDRYNPSKLTTIDKDELRKRLNISPSTFVLMYLGSWGTWYLVDEMLLFYRVLKKFCPDSVFLIVSQDNINLTRNQQSLNIKVVSAAYAEVPLFISLATCAIFFIKTSFSKRASSATKLGEVMAMGIPIITNSNWGDINKLDKDAGIVLESLSEKDFELGMEEWLKRLSRLQPYGIITKKHPLSIISGINSYEAIYQKLMDAR